MMAKKRSKRSRLRGRRTCGWGSRKKHRGKGSRGGKGMAGTGKRADHHKTFIHKYYGPNYFGKIGFVPLAKKELKVMNLDFIEKNLDSMIKKGIAKKTPKGIEINLEGYKILGAGSLKNKISIKAESFSKSAEEKITQAGGTAEIIGKEKKEEESSEKKKSAKEKSKKTKEEKSEEQLAEE